MNQKSGTFLKGLLAKFSPTKEEALIGLLSKEDQKVLEKCFHPEKLFGKSDWLSDIHPSWLADLPPLQEMTSFQKTFFLSYLKKRIVPPEILPKEHLPPSPLNPLLDLPKDRFFQLIDLLGIYDLSVEMRKIINKNLLVKIENALTKGQLEFLKFANTQPVKWTPPPLHLERWDGEKKTLYALLHKRGLYRLGKSAKMEEKSFQWHLAHKVDTKRGEFLLKLFVGKEDPAMITFFKGQVGHLINRVSL